MSGKDMFAIDSSLNPVFPKNGSGGNRVEATRMFQQASNRAMWHAQQSDTKNAKFWSGQADQWSSYIDSKTVQLSKTDQFMLEWFGKPAGTAGSMVPVVGSLRNSVYNYSKGNLVAGTVDAAGAASDVFLVKSVLTGLVKGALKTGSNTWSATRKWYGQAYDVAKGTPVHHWAIPQNGWGKVVPNWIKNQPWNLMPMESPEFHRAVHGVGTHAFNALERIWYGTPAWSKVMGISVGTRVANEVGGSNDSR
jgi:hypothetical protein